jgi:hypothetical protein
MAGNRLDGVDLNQAANRTAFRSKQEMRANVE